MLLNIWTSPYVHASREVCVLISIFHIMILSAIIIVLDVLGILLATYGGFGLLFKAPKMAKEEQQNAATDLAVLEKLGACAGESDFDAGVRKLDLFCRSQGQCLKTPGLCLICYGIPLLIGVIFLIAAYFIK